jgi:hypothetical protein
MWWVIFVVLVGVSAVWLEVKVDRAAPKCPTCKRSLWRP